jgi:histidinol-phosphate aminotransferase
MLTQRVLRKGLKMIKAKESVQRMKPYNPPTAGRVDFVRLDFNENTWGCSPKVVKALKSLSADEISTYPDYGELRKKLAKYLKVKKGEVFPTNASDEAIKIVMDVYVDNGQEVILPVPTFAMFRFYAEVAGAKINPILYNRDLSFPADKVMKAISNKTKIIVLVNPNNPTGTPIKREDIIRILEKAKNSIVLLDEAYYQFTKESCVDLINEYTNLVILQTFSKAFGMAGLRLGYVVSNKNNIANMLKASSPYSVNVAAVKAAFAAIDDRKYVGYYVKQVKESKKMLYKAFKDLGVKTYPSAGNFILAYLGDKAPDVCSKLRKENILVRNRSNDVMLDGCIRITCGKKSQTAMLIKELKKILK